MPPAGMPGDGRHQAAEPLVFRVLAIRATCAIWVYKVSLNITPPGFLLYVLYVLSGTKPVTIHIAFQHTKYALYSTYNAI